MRFAMDQFYEDADSLFVRAYDVLAARRLMAMLPSTSALRARQADLSSPFSRHSWASAAAC